MLPSWLIAIIAAVGLFSFVADWKGWFSGKEGVDF